MSLKSVYLLLVPKLNVIFKCEELKDGVNNGHHECEDQQVDVGLEEGLLDAVLILVILLLPHQVAEDIESIPELLGRVHLPLEHRYGLERDGDVEKRRAGNTK